MYVCMFLGARLISANLSGTHRNEALLIREPLRLQATGIAAPVGTDTQFHGDLIHQHRLWLGEALAYGLLAPAWMAGFFAENTWRAASRPGPAMQGLGQCALSPWEPVCHMVLHVACGQHCVFIPAKTASLCGSGLPAVALVNTGLGSGLMANSSQLLGVQLAGVLLEFP